MFGKPVHSAVPTATRDIRVTYCGDRLPKANTTFRFVRQIGLTNESEEDRPKRNALRGFFNRVLKRGTLHICDEDPEPFRVILEFSRSRMVSVLVHDMPGLWRVARYHSGMADIWLTLGTTFILESNDLQDYGLVRGSHYHIRVKYSLTRGGNGSDRDGMASLEQAERFIQLFESGHFDQLGTRLQSMAGSDVVGTYICDKIFAVMLSIRNYHTNMDWFTWLMNTYGLMTGHSPINDVKDLIHLHFGQGDYVQAEGNFRTFIRDARKLFDAGTRDNETFKKLLTLYGAMAARGWLRIFDVEADPKRIQKFMSHYHLPEWCETAHFGIVFLDTLLFICERSLDYIETGDVRSLLHSQQLYLDWFEKAERIQLLSNFLGNLEAHDTNTFEFANLLNDVIERGEAYAKTCKRTSVSDRNLVTTLNKLKVIKATTLVKEASSQMRRAPLGVLLHGLSGQAKSTFCNMVKHYYANFSGLPGEDSYTYVRSPVQEYWCNFNSAQWCVIFDDIAFLNPKAANGIDPTIAEVLNVVNNVPYDAPQAALEDKGKTPVLADLVIATTNVEHINASDYFACPFAVRRRLPVIITVEAKSEFCKTGTKQIDPSKIIHDDTEYPNVWNIYVKKLVAVEDGGVEHARVELIKKYTDVNEFFRYFGSVIISHNENQRACMQSNDSIRKVPVCKQCFGVGKFCTCNVQADDGDDTDISDHPDLVLADGHMRYYSWFRYFVNQFYSRCIEYAQDQISHFIGFMIMLILEQTLAQWVFKWRIPRWILILIVRCIPLHPRTGIAIIGFINARALDNPHRTKWINAACFALQFFLMFSIGFLTVRTVGATVGGMFENVIPWKKTQTDEEACEIIEGDDVSSNAKSVCDVYPLDCDAISDDGAEPDDYWGQQGNRFGTSAEQLEKETLQNVWYNNTPAITSFDIPTKGRSLVNKTAVELRRMFHNNVVRICVNDTMEMNAVFITSQVLMFNTHALGTERRDDNTIDIYCGDKYIGLSPKTRSHFKLSEVRSIEGRDISFIVVHGLPPFKDLLEFWGDNPKICADEAYQFVRQKSGEMVINHIRGLQNMTVTNIFEQPIPVLYGVGNLVSQKGWCGSLVMVTSPIGCLFTGIHVLGKEKSVASHLVTKSTISAMIADLMEWSVQSGSPPNLFDRKLGDIHPRCLTRYIPQGNIHVYGSFIGFRPKPKTKVKVSPIADDICEHFGSPLLHTKPCMSGWEPWHKNFVEMVKNNTCLDVPAFERCIDNYVESCIAELPDEWEKELVDLTTEQAIRGIPGVKYIDALNKNTSMGFPWGGPKKRFVVDTPTEEDPGSFTMTQEVLDIVDELEQQYLNGERGNPIFTAHLKDEPVTFEKASVKKTRVFTGSPAPYAIVLRKHLLPFIRLMQKNPFVFESMPGYCAQSRDWGKLYDWLTHFGKDTIIAGDYGKYDKRMAAYLIVAAYRIIARFYQKAGFDNIKCRAIVAMGYDCAFSWCNFNGTLVQFFGTNPSGHSLTVIINCLVNALYIRYVYLKANPDNELDSFKDNVRLATYGDDNIAGVNPLIGEWFNHTVVQQSLATIGVEYTMADKESESVPFIHISQASFLKRSWYEDHDVGAFLCPLDMDSIFRSLTVWGPSTMADDHRVVEVVTNAVCEFFFYGKEKFEKERDFFLQYLDKPQYLPYIRHPDVLPTWEECRGKFEYLSSPVGTHWSPVSSNVLDLDLQ